MPPVNGFWSLSIYNEHHFFVRNPINRFSVGTKNKDLKFAADGSLTIYVQAEAPTDPVNAPTGCRRPKRRFLALRPCLLAQGGNHRGFMDAAGGKANGGPDDGREAMNYARGRRAGDRFSEA